MKNLPNLMLVVLFQFTVTFAFGQVDLVQQLIDEGVTKHDSGKYAEAIALYQRALQLNPTSSVANYEISYSYLMDGDYRNAVKYSRIAIKQKDDSQLSAYITCGSALDMMGKTNRSIKVYEKAMKRYDYYLLYYNHAVSCLVGGKLNKAYNSAIKAIQDNPSHASSHLILSKIMARKGERVKAMLPLYFFLLLEPDTPRATMAYENLRKYMDAGVSEKPGKKIVVSVPVKGMSDFAAAEMLLSLAKTTQTLDKDSTDTDLQHFAEINEQLFKGLGELKKDHTGFWWDFYVTFFSEMADKGLSEAYSYYISQLQGEEATDWFDWHNDDFERFKIWVSVK